VRLLDHHQERVCTGRHLEEGPEGGGDPEPVRGGRPSVDQCTEDLGLALGEVVEPSRQGLAQADERRVGEQLLLGRGPMVEHASADRRQLDRGDRDPLDDEGPASSGLEGGDQLLELPCTRHSAHPPRPPAA
jgi:hypothetical protein